MIGLLRSRLSAMLQFVFFCENASVAAANKEISVELADADEEGLVEDVSLGFAAEVVGP
jgi:hypothetical protein